MSSFTNKLTLTFLGDGLWETDREFGYYVGEEFSMDLIVVKEGFVTDLASVPWPASLLIPKSGNYNQSAVLHDYLYMTQERTRKESDDIFIEAMRILDVPPWKRQIMYNAVRTFGWIPWMKKRKKLEEAKKIKKITDLSELS